MSLISIVFFFSIPRFRNSVFTTSAKEVSRWITVKVPILKENSVRLQKLYILNIDIDSGILWITNESMSEEERLIAKSSGFVLPDDVKIIDVEYPDSEIISAGTADIGFYKQGCSDKASIHIEDDDGNQLTFLIEPFLSKVKLYEEYVTQDSHL